MAIASVVVLAMVYAPPTFASVSQWQNGFNVLPQSPDDFGSSSFQQSLQKMKNDGANTVVLVVPYYQADIHSTAIYSGYNTPTDTSLTSAIDYAHSIGLSVAIKIFIDPQDGTWRAYINPNDRAAWFANYGSTMLHTAQLAQAHHAEMMILGTELVSMATYAINGDNTGRWQNLISQVRNVYSGKLTYGANSNNNINDPFQNEKKYIGFWDSLDYVGLSTYYSLNPNGGNDLNSLMGAWDYWNKSDIQPFENSVNKPILFLEVGYRSVTGAHNAPWDWTVGGGYDATEQSNDYQALFQYWNNYNYVGGVFWWNWSTHPNAGGSGDTSFTPQNKPVESIIRQWFTAPPSGGGGGGTPTFMTSASVNPSQSSANTMSTITATVKDTGAALNDGIIDIEVYDANNNRKFQQFFSSQSIAAGATQTYTAQWMPTSAGTYRVAIGVFSSDWSTAYNWQANAGVVIVTQGSGGGGGSGGNYTTDVWWPSDGSKVSGMQPFKALVEGMTPSQYSMWWQVDGGTLNSMSSSSQDYPHKEALVDLSNWKWKGNGPYTVTFVSRDGNGTLLSQKSVSMYVY